ncbi:MAG TPA: hypothetical protein VJB36_10620 [Methylomirabilota bacterium]|nr:hypothetical protein [Methylomirabilota bacterium]
MRAPLRLLLIPVALLVLGGIVWINVAKLGVTRETAEIVKQNQSLEAQIAQLDARLADLRSKVYTGAEASGMVLPTSDKTTRLQGGAATIR